LKKKILNNMKKIVLIALSLLVASVGLQAQDSPKKMMSKASKYFGSYSLDPAANKEKLGEAYEMITLALEDEEIAGEAKAWLIKGKILNEMANEEVKRKILDPNYAIVNKNSAFEASEALMHGFSIAEKGYRQKDALKSLIDTENHLNNFGIYAFQERDYAEAYLNFDKATRVYRMLKENEAGEDSRLNDPAVYNEHIFYTGVSAYYGDLSEEAKPYFLELYNAGSDEPLVYEALFTIAEEQDEQEALGYLNTGREKFPNNTGLLFAEINHYVRKGELEKMIGKLEMALELEPDNVSIYTTLGSVYDNLTSKAMEAEDEEAIKVNFDKALGYFEKATEMEPDNFDAIYSIGALYYNSAANMTKEINKYANDFSKEGTKKYNEAKEKMDALFEKSLPYFEKAESINPDDPGVLQALSEIYARKNELEKSMEFKKRLEGLEKEGPK
jgi:tetratricopeptide (TPR) repeat protein